MDVETSKFEGETDEGFGVLFEAVSKNLTMLVTGEELGIEDKLDAIRIQASMADTLAKLAGADAIASAIRDLATATREQTEAMVKLEASTRDEPKVICMECGRLAPNHKMDCGRGR